MPTFEVLFKVGDTQLGPGDTHSQLEHWEDGMVYTDKKPGLWWTAAEWFAWVDGGAGNRPSGFAGLPNHLQPQWRRLRLKQKWFRDPAFTRLYHINSRNTTTWTQAELDSAANATLVAQDAECAEIEPNIQAQIDAITANGGMDTNWGWGELKDYGVVTIDATPGEMNRLDREVDDETYNVFGPRHVWAKRAWRVNYQGFLTAPEIAALADPAVLVNVDRSGATVPFATAAVEVARDLVNNPEGPGLGSAP